jgi:hypothetical protein
MWLSLLKIQYTELKFSCENDAVVKYYIHSNSEIDLWPNDPWFSCGRRRTLFILVSIPLYRLIIYIDGRILWCTHFLLLLYYPSFFDLRRPITLLVYSNFSWYVITDRNIHYNSMQWLSLIINKPFRISSNLFHARQIFLFVILLVSMMCIISVSFARQLTNQTNTRLLVMNKADIQLTWC